MSESAATTRVVVPATLERFNALHQALDAFYASSQWLSSQRPDADWQGCLNTAVLEICGNVIRHAYPLPDPPGTLTLTLRRYEDRVEARLCDQGIEFVE